MNVRADNVTLSLSHTLANKQIPPATPIELYNGYPRIITGNEGSLLRFQDTRRDHHHFSRLKRGNAIRSPVKPHPPPPPPPPTPAKHPSIQAWKTYQTHGHAPRVGSAGLLQQRPQEVRVGLLRPNDQRQ